MILVVTADPHPLAKRAFIIVQCVAIAAVIAIAFFTSNEPTAVLSLGCVTFLIAGAFCISEAILASRFVREGGRRLGAIALIVIESVALVMLPGWISQLERERITLDDPARAVADARKLIEVSGEQKLLGPNDLPESLRLPGLLGAQAHGDHLDLINYRDPDGHAGFRVWAAGSSCRREEKATRYPDVFIYSWTNDRPEAPDNMP